MSVEEKVRIGDPTVKYVKFGIKTGKGFLWFQNETDKGG